MKKLFIFIILCSLLGSNLTTQEAGRDLAWYSAEAEAAIGKENYEYAVTTLKKGIKLFPESPVLNIRLADLYFDRELYSLALNEYEAANNKSPDDFDTMDRLQSCLGYLNREEESIAYLEKMLELYPMQSHPESYYTVHDLGWMYLKTHKLEAGEKLLLEHIAQRGETESKRSLLMSLATIYSGMYEYEASRQNYLAAIGEALEVEDSLFAAIAYYNLSLLEYNFYNFNSAMQYTNDSLRQHDRATGHLAKGELYQRQMDYVRARAEYEEGLSTEDSPLTTINMAILFRKFGLLDSARQFAESVSASGDLSWIINFGTDADNHRKEMHKLLADVYNGLYKRQSLIPQSGLPGELHSLLLKVWYWLKYYYHNRMFKSYAIRIGQELLKEQNLLDAYLEFYRGNTDYKQVALKYLALARDYETAIAPAAAPYYLQEEGKVLKSAERLKATLAQFDPFWEKESLSESLELLIPLTPARSPARRQTINSAYAINPGGVFAAGYGLPLQLKLFLDSSTRGQDGRIRRLLKKAGSQIMDNSITDAVAAGFPYTLEIYWLQESGPSFVLLNSKNGEVVLSGSIDPGEGKLAVQCVTFIRRLLLEHLYVPRGYEG